MHRLHSIVGVAGLVAFVLTGQYMHWMLDHLQGLEPAPRLFWRSSHLYLMWASALNVALGFHFVPVESGVPGIVQKLSSLAILAAPVLLCLSFFFEPYNPELARPLSRYANLLAFAGISLQVLVWWFRRRASSAALTPPAV